MCGITGAISLKNSVLDSKRFKPMVDVIAHRGPDDAGYLLSRTPEMGAPELFTDTRFANLCPDLTPIDSEAGKKLIHENAWKLFLGHRRLAIIDTSSSGHQPMSQETGEIWVVYNGEIYNFRELRAELRAKHHVFRSNTDTEVIVHAYEQWGIECVQRFNGMFAFALWDSRQGMLFLARDRYGIKPLYYSMTNDGVLLFGSEIKSILEYMPTTPGVDLLALDEYFSFQNTFSYRTLFEGIRLLPPGSFLEIASRTGDTSLTGYWDFKFVECRDSAEPELREQLYDLIDKAVTRQCVSDVPIGSYLSGGMDSSTIAALTARNLGRIFTFTAGFDLSEAAEHELSFDERELAEFMANKLQTEHYECVLHSGDMEAVMEKLIWQLEDLRVGQCYPNYYVAGLAGKFLKVIMSGIGSDELFGGYPWRYATAIGVNGGNYVENYYRYWKRLLNEEEKQRFFSNAVKDCLADIQNPHSGDNEYTLDVFRSVFRNMPDPRSITEKVNHSLYFECKTFLHGLLLVEDKLSMAHSLETRVPFLDNDIVDFACRLPVHCKIAQLENLPMIDENYPRKKALYRTKTNAGKNILRTTMERILPSHVTTAGKQGFSAPDESWFRGRSKDYVHDVLLSTDARIHEFINPASVATFLRLHSSGSENRRLLIWSLLSLEIWLKTFR